MLVFSSVADYSFAKGGGGRGGGGRSSSSSRSSSSKSSSGKSTWGSSSGSKTSSTTSKKTGVSSADKAAAMKSYSSKYTTREQAVSSFKTQNSTKYTNKFQSEPAKKPDYIPNTYKDSSGNTYNVTYNQGLGGYGYQNSLGQWMLYDTLSDAIMINTLMDKDPQYREEPKNASGSAEAKGGSNLGWWVLGGVGVIVVAMMFAL